MIASIQGEVLFTGKNSVVVNVGGIGIKVFTTSHFIDKARTGDKVFLYTHLIVREDELSLYGFESEIECEYFALLLSVNGIGPRIALAVLSTLTVDAIRRAVLSEQPEIFSRVPGIGTKGAQRILISLQGKVGSASDLQITLASDTDTEVIEALTALGYSVVEAQTAIQSLPKDASQKVEERLYLALQYFSGK